MATVLYEKEAKESFKKRYSNNIAINSYYAEGFNDGYNKANEWHYLKDEDLPPEDTKVLALMANKEIYIAHFYRKNVWDKIGTVIAWKEIVLPELPKVDINDR